MQLNRRSGQPEIDVLRRYNSTMVLTKAEQITWDLCQQGLTTKEIAMKLGVKYGTVNVRMQVIREKMRFNDGR
ncbi:MAG: hypothetical protein EB015_14730 [Methylocystaceae bacterium]|jgi:DNA-binding CsgD family transcriptional regulator|nr:hypothetical protein [Methylocystaceae bacterium]